MIGQIADDAFPARDRESGTAYNEARVSTGTRCETDMFLQSETSGLFMHRCFFKAAFINRTIGFSDCHVN